jgi:hypothetical protein
MIVNFGDQKLDVAWSNPGSFGDTRSTSWASHDHDLIHQNSLDEGFPPRTPLSQNLGKPQNQAPLLTDLGGKSHGK